jgi:DNA polymerase-3 subunit alpha
MKANFPVEFLAASMTLDMGNTDKLAEFRSEAQRLGIKVVAPCVNRSGVQFDVEGNSIFYALAALKGVGAQAVQTIIDARRNKPFADLSDFASRINPRAVNKRVLESLAASGAFEALEVNRAVVFAAADIMMAVAQREHESTESGALQFSFGGNAAKDAMRLPKVEPWLPTEKLQKEFDAIGFFLSGHPLDDYMVALKRMRVQSWVEFSKAVKSGASAGRVAGTVVARTERRTRTGSKMGIIGLSDPSGHFEAVLFSEGLQQFRDLLEPGSAVLLALSAELQGEDVRARIQMVEPLDQATAKLQKGLRVFLRSEAPLESIAKRLEATRAAPPRSAPGAQATPLRSAADRADGEVSMVLLLDKGAEVEVKLPGRFKVSPQIAGAIKAVPGVIDVQAL